MDPSRAVPRRSIGRHPLVARGPQAARWFRWGCLFLLELLAGGGAAWAAEAGAYQETLPLRWGIVKDKTGAQASHPAWYTAQVPAFGQSGLFTPAEVEVLLRGFDRAAGTVGSTPVWRIDRLALFLFFQDVGKSARLTITAMGAAPAPRADGAASTLPWSFTFQWTRPAPAAPPNLEFTLLVSGIAPGEAAHVPLAAALAHSRIRTFAALTPTQENALQANASWMRLFLTAPATLQPGTFPRVRECDSATELDAFAIPIAYGLRALAEAEQVLSVDRVYSPANEEALAEHLAVGSSQRFAGTDQWFPMAGKPGDLDGATVRGAELVDPVAVHRPQPDHPFLTSRVGPEVEWVVVVGPFYRVNRADAHVAAVLDHGETIRMADLDRARPNNPAARDRIRADTRAIDTDLAEVLEHNRVATGDFFWRPDVKQNHGRAMRALERVRFVENVSAEFDPDGVSYSAVYAPAKIDGNLGLGYAPERGGEASGELSWTGLLRPSDSFHLSLKIAEHRTTADLDYKQMVFRGLDRRTYHWLSLAGAAGQDDRFLLGDIDHQAFRNRTTSVGIGDEFDMQAALAKNDRSSAWTATLATTLLQESFELGHPGRTGTVQDAGVLVRHQEVWHLTPTPDAKASVVWEHTVSPSITYAPALGWEASFGTFTIAASTRASFGGEPGDQKGAMYLGLRGALGGSAGNLPLGYRFRFGDEDHLVGLEPGEISGRSYSHAELSYGANLGYALGGLFKDAAGVKSPPPALNAFNIEALAEVGTISPVSRLGAFGPGHTTVTSYGIAVEKPPDPGQTSHLRVGYAWSPDSIHRRGRIFASLAVGF